MAKRLKLAPIVMITPFVVAGILLGEYLEVEAWRSGLVAAVCIVCAIVWRRKRMVADIYTAAAVVFVATTSATLQQTPTDLDYDTTLTTTTTITSVPIERGRWRVCDATIVAKGQQYKVALHTDTAMVAPALGEQGILTTTLRRLPEGSYGSLMSRRGYSAFCYTRGVGNHWQPTGHISSPSIWAKRYQHKLVGKVDQMELPPDQAAVVKAMVLGWKGEMSNELKNAYTRSGCAHLLAISGLHVGIVAMLVWAMLWFMPRVGCKGHVWRNWLTIGVMVLYAVITGMSPSVMRATIMFCSAQVGLSMGSINTSVATLSTALGAMMIVWPNTLFDISFQLSAIAVVGILVSYMPMRRALTTRWLVPNALLSSLLIGLCAMVVTLPLVSHTFGIIGLAGVVANPIVIFLANILILFTLVWLSIVSICPSNAVRWVVTTVAEAQNKVVEATSNWQWATIETSPSEAIVVCSYVLMAGALIYGYKHRDKIYKWSITK